MAMVPLIAVAAVVQMAMMTGGYGDEEAREMLLAITKKENTFAWL